MLKKTFSTTQRMVDKQREKGRYDDWLQSSLKQADFDMTRSYDVTEVGHRVIYSQSQEVVHEND